MALTPSRNLIAATSNGLFLLDLSAEPTTAVVSDLALSSTVTPNSVSAGENLTYQLTVANQGPEAATSVVLTMTLTAGTSLVSAEPQGACQGTDTVTCNLGVIDNGAAAVVTIVVTPSVAGDLNQQAQVSTGSTDPNGANNSVSMSATVSGSLQGGNGGGAGVAPGGDDGNDGVSTGGSGGGGGGGCTMKNGGEFDPTFVGLFGIVFVLLLRRSPCVRTRLGIFFLIGLAFWFAPRVSYSSQNDLNLFNTNYGTAGTRLNTCTLCHTASPPTLNPYGSAYKAEGRNNPASFGTIESSDSDGDLWTNLEEINARTFPGNAADKIIVTLTPSTDARFDRPGMAVTFTLQVQNTGSSTDTYAVTVTGNSWTTTAGSVGSLASSATTRLTVTVAIPTTASAGASDTAAVTVTSQGDSTKSATATLTSTAFSAPSLGEWVSVGKLSGTTFHAAAAEKTDDGIAYAAGGSNVYKSTDDGNSWSPLAGGIAGQNVRALAVSGQIIYGATPDGKLFKSVNGGDSWTDVLAPFAAQGLGEQVASIAVDPANSGILYTGDFKLTGYDFTTDSLVIKSTDGGTNWAHLPNPPISGAELHAHAIAIDPTTPTTLYAGGTGTPNLAKSTDGGTTWTDIPITGVSVFVQSLAIDPKITSTIYAGTATQGIFKSVNNGGTFTPVNTGLPAVLPIVYALLIHPDDRNQIFAATSAGLYFSPDGGEHWVARSSGLTTTSAQSIKAVALTPSLILIGGTEDGLFILDLSTPPTDGTDSGSGGNGGTGGGSIGGSRGGGGGGCALGGDGAADALLPGLFCFALGALVWRKCFLKDKKYGAPGRNRTYSQ
ncbi:MAG: JDVT-CTERM domain-containing protein [Candidatus Manganitrophus sp.]|nr:MAG: JDVT-CTERM domain-containing protein [Candidatus Manganitrophus sp.]